MREDATDGPSPEDTDRRAAQDTAGELARMGIDPGALGLEPVSGPPADNPPGASGRIRGVAPVREADPRPVSVPPSQPSPETSMFVREVTSLNRPLGGPPTRTVPGDHIVEPLERLADEHRSRVPATWRRGARATAFGLLQPSAAHATEQEQRLVARVRTRRPEPRVVTFVAGKGGVGTTTTAIGVALTLATLRTDHTTLVDARHGSGSLAGRLAGLKAPTVLHMHDNTPDRLPATPLRIRGVLGVVDGTPWHTPVPRRQLLQVLENLKEENAFTLVDVGNDTSESGHGALARADQVVVVTTASHDAIQSTRIALSRIRQVDPQRLGTISVAVTCLNTRAHRRTYERLRDQLGLAYERLVTIPFDPALATGRPLEPSALRPVTREAFLRLAAHVADPGAPERSALQLESTGDDPLAYLAPPED